MLAETQGPQYRHLRGGFQLKLEVQVQLMLPGCSHRVGTSVGASCISRHNDLEDGVPALQNFHAHAPGAEGAGIYDEVSGESGLNQGDSLEMRDSNAG